MARISGKRIISILLSGLAGTIIPWVLGALSLLVLLTLAIVIKSWRDVKRSPYFFMRQQAAKRLQTYSSMSLLLIIVTAVTAAYTLQPSPVDDTPRVALLANTKPATEEVRALLEASPLVVEETAETTGTEQEVISTTTAATTVTTTAAVAESQALPVSSESLLQAALTLPEEFDKLEPRVELKEDTKLGSISFSTQINREYEAVEPGSIFAEGAYTLYATFSYEAMENGMEWAWVWRRDGEVVGGGNELWNYGEEGPGYIYYNPEEGFQNGQYSLEVWVNGELLTRSNITINSAAVSAGN